MKKIAFIADVHLSDTPPKVRKDLDYLGTLLNKLEFIINNNEHIIFLGDLFKTPSVSNYSMCRIIDFFKRVSVGKEIYSIIGNHDVPYLNSTLLHKTSLGVLNKAGCISVIQEGISIDGVVIKVIPFKRNIECPSDMDILIGHCFFESELDAEFSLTSDKLTDSRCKLVILGHDHSPYNNKKVNNCEIIRTGSICRDSYHSYNLDELGNRVSYCQVIVENGKIISHENIKVPVLSPREVFFEEVFTSIEKKNNKFSYMYDIGSLLEKYQNKNEKVENSVLTVLSVMKEMKVPSDIISYVKDRYTGLGMVLK